MINRILVFIDAYQGLAVADELERVIDEAGYNSLLINREWHDVSTEIWIERINALAREFENLYPEGKTLLVSLSDGCNNGDKRASWCHGLDIPVIRVESADAGALLADIESTLDVKKTQSYTRATKTWQDFTQLLSGRYATLREDISI